MTARVPSREYKPGGQLRCPPREIAVRAWQAHLIKHPFGMNALMSPRLNGGKRQWNEEGWDVTVPPVITAGTRADLVQKIESLRVAGAVCKVPRLSNESYGGDVPADWEACYRCSAELATECASSTKSIGDAYSRVVDETLGLLDGGFGAVVSRADLSRSVWQAVATPTKLTGLAVLTLGCTRARDSYRLVARISRWDSMRVEFTLDGSDMRWRTTYRNSQRSLGALLTFLMDYAETPEVPLKLSDKALVPRQWSEENGVGR